MIIETIIEIHDVILGIDLVIHAGDDLIVNGDVILDVILVYIHGIIIITWGRKRRLGGFGGWPRGY